MSMNWFVKIVFGLALMSGCGHRNKILSGPSFKSGAADLETRINSAGDRCNSFRAPGSLGASSVASFCEPFYDASLVVMGISAGPNRPEKAFVGMMPYVSTGFSVVLSDGTKLETETDAEGFFALQIETNAQIEEVVISPSSRSRISCKSIDIDSPPCS
jgi:hypothetical protein